MRLQLDFAAQMLGHFFEGRDKIIADARTLGARSALGEPIAFPALSFQLNGSTGGDILALCLATPLLASRLLDAFERHQKIRGFPIVR